MNRNIFLIVINIIIIAFYLYVVFCNSCSMTYFWWDSFLTSSIALIFMSIMHSLQIINGLILKKNGYFKLINYLLVINCIVSIFYWIFILWVFNFEAFSYYILILTFVAHVYLSSKYFKIK